MERITQIVAINSLDDIPSVDHILETPRSKKLKLVFADSINEQRETIGQKLKNELKGFSIGVHMIEPRITIAKLITDSEIENNQLFFEQCAKDYRKLAHELICKLAHKFNLIIDPQGPMATFNPMKRDERQRGRVSGWYYFLHGAHCAFHNMMTKQIIETPLIYGAEFGVLDPYFFTRFIKSTPAYKPLSIDIYEDYEDGVRINQVMVMLGRFEKINSNSGDEHSAVVADRDDIGTEICKKPKV